MTVPDSSDEIAIVDASAATTKKITREDFLKGADLPNDTVTTNSIADGAVTADKLDFTTLVFGNYSTTEVDTGFKWIDGKSIYKKTVSFGALPNSTAKNVPHGISGLGWLINVEAMSQATSTFAALNRTASSFVVYNVDATNIVVTTNSNSTAYTTTYVTLWYTKA